MNEFKVWGAITRREKLPRKVKKQMLGLRISGAQLRRQIKNVDLNKPNPPKK